MFVWALFGVKKKGHSLVLALRLAYVIGTGAAVPNIRQAHKCVQNEVKLHALLY